MAFRIAQVQTKDREVNQVQQNIKQAIEPIFAEQSGSFVVTLTGCTTRPTSTLFWEQGVKGGGVTVSVPLPIEGVSNSTLATLLGLPKALWPRQVQYVQVPTIDNGVTAMATAGIEINGTISLYRTLTGSAMTAAGVKGLFACTFSYIVGI